MCDRVISKVMVVYCPDRDKTLRMCDEPVDDCLAALKFPGRFVTIKMFF